MGPPGHVARGWSIGLGEPRFSDWPLKAPFTGVVPVQLPPIVSRPVCAHAHHELSGTGLVKELSSRSVAVKSRALKVLRSVATVISDSTPNRASDPFHAPRMAVIMMIIHARIAQVAGRRRRPVSSDSLRELTVSFCRSLRSRTQGATGFPEVPRTVPIKPSVVTRLASHGAKKRLLPESDRGDSRPRFFHFAELDAALSKADIETAKCPSAIQFRPA